MARRRKFGARRAGRRRGGMGSIMSYIKPLAIGTVAGIVANRAADYAPQIRSIPFFKGIAGVGANYAMGQRAMPKLAVGAAGGEFLSQPIGTAAGQMIGMRVF